MNINSHTSIDILTGRILVEYLSKAIHEQLIDKNKK